MDLRKDLYLQEWDGPYEISARPIRSPSRGPIDPEELARQLTPAGQGLPGKKGYSFAFRRKDEESDDEARG